MALRARLCTGHCQGLFGGPLSYRYSGRCGAGNHHERYHLVCQQARLVRKVTKKPVQSFGTMACGGENGGSCLNTFSFRRTLNRFVFPAIAGCASTSLRALPGSTKGMRRRLPPHTPRYRRDRRPPRETASDPRFYKRSTKRKGGRGFRTLSAVDRAFEVQAVCGAREEVAERRE